MILAIPSAKQDQRQEILKMTIKDLMEQRNMVMLDIEKKNLQNISLKNDYKHQLRDHNKIMSNSSYNVIYLKSNNVKDDLIEYYKKKEQVKSLLQDLNNSKDAINESIKSLAAQLI